ncbi:GH36-type glycosyl hydrolase domain-containing protein [Konateibacter massiliensis]|uniref:GH36-type glycosyl hydrolase domain-containing protein n=1 Tax=Konateibacter massiliensis TaxID=2002841 RepID=UPI000C15527A|nr:cellobiose phosphorylase [Konateibacter massiliensis]
MAKYQYKDKNGKFSLENPETYSYLYFPMANEAGMMSSITPDLGGDSKTDQNTFILSPVSSENLHNDKSSRNIWCKINQKDIWSAAGKSSRQQAELFSGEKESTVLEAEFMCHTIERESKKVGIRAKIESFVPCDKAKVELMRVTLRNISEESMTIQPVAAIPLYGRSADNIRDHRHVTALLHRIQTKQNGIALKPTLTFDERGHQENEVVYGVFGSCQGKEPIGYIPTIEEFIGEGGSLENPRALYQNPLPMMEAGASVCGYEAMGALVFQEYAVKPDEEISLIIAIGLDREEEKLLHTASYYLQNTQFESALQKTKKYWHDKVNVSYETGNEDFNNWMSWVSFQPMLRRIYGCSFLPHHDYGKGGRGWRDLWQDCLALLIMEPEAVRQMLIDNFGGVRIDGTNATIIGSRQGEFIADRNNITRVWMDHGMWPFLTTDLYIQQTGDIKILLEENYYFKDIQACRGEEKDFKWEDSQGNHVRDEKGQDYKGTILEHLLIQNLTAFYDVGEHNHIKIRGADWNDALDMAKENGESVAFTNMYASNLEKIGDLLLTLEERGIHEISVHEELLHLLKEDWQLYESKEQKQELLEEYCRACLHQISGRKVDISCKAMAKNLKEKGRFIKEHIRSKEWIALDNGDAWYNGYYDNQKRRVEGENNNEVRMMLTSQVFSVMAETATAEQVKEIIKSADKYLYNKQVGGYKLNTDFHEVKTDLGRMFGFAYGHKENGAVFSHMAVMYANALYSRGEAKAGYKVINTLFEHCNNFELSKIYPGVPEYIDARGRGMYHYLTGAASWLLVTVITKMYGVQGEIGNLKLEPQLLKEQFDGKKQASLAMQFGGKNLRIVYRNEENLETGEYKIKNITIDDVPYKTDTPWIAESDIKALSQESHLVMVELGR